MNPMSSKDLEWDVDRPERSQELLEQFDIQKAKRFIAEGQPRPIASQNLDGKYREYFESYLEEVRFRPNVDWTHVDTNIPVIFGTESDGRKIPLDGRHRIAKALKDGLREIPVIYLTAAETEAIRSGPRI